VEEDDHHQVSNAHECWTKDGKWIRSLAILPADLRS
jgi:hypothetical protein